MPEGILKDQIEALAKEVGFPSSNIYIIEGSRKSRRSVAFMLGIFSNSRIFLSDTLVKESLRFQKEIMNEKKVAERGPKQKKRPEFTTEEVVAIVGHELGHWKMHHALKGYIIMEVLHFCLSMFARYNEFQADKFACKLNLGKDLKTALIKHSSKRFPVYDYLFSMWHHTHPALLDRLRTIDDLTKM